MAIIGIEEIFLKVKDLEKAIEFYHGILGIPLDKQDGERTYLQTERSHLVLQIENHTGRHQGGGPLLSLLLIPSGAESLVFRGDLP